MWRVVYALLFVNVLQYGTCFMLWPKGVVHFAVNNKDYDIHSQDIILKTFADIEREICVKFFNTPPNYNATADTKILYITNPDKRKNCPPSAYNFSANVVDMPIGYKCLDSKNIARVVVDMLRASIEQTVQTINSFDLIRKFQEMQEDPNRPYLLTPEDRNYINAHYHAECRALQHYTPVQTRRSDGAVSLSKDNLAYYKDKLWPFGVVIYEIKEDLRDSPYAAQLKYAMMTIELATCVVFQEVTSQDTEVIQPKHLLFFDADGADAPAFGFHEGEQVISIDAMIKGAPGHTSHTLNLLFRALGVPMMSNRPDRDNYVTVNWRHVTKGKEFYLEKNPMEAWVRDSRLPYDFDSVTHAPANFMCSDCSKGQATIVPAHDHLWQRVMIMGHHRELSAGDKELINILYADRCRDRFTTAQ